MECTKARRTLAAGVLAVLSAACFLAALGSALELRERTGAIARYPLWQTPPLDSRIAEVEEDVSPAEMEAEPVEAEPPLRQQLLGVRKKSVSVPSPVRPVEPVERQRPLEVDPADAMRMALRGKRASFEHCYEQELKKQASFNGFIVVALSLSANGTVTDARVQEGNLRDAVVGACIVAQLRTLKLPMLTSEADLLIPIRLQASEPT